VVKIPPPSHAAANGSADAFFARAIDDARRQNIPLPDGPIKTNGQYQSYKKNKADKKKTMRLKAHADGIPNIRIWDWSKGKEPIFTAKGSIPNGMDAAGIAEEAAANSARREAEAAERHAKAAAETERLLATLPLADPNHPYLKAKGVEPPDSIRQQGNDLFIPVMRNGKYVGGEIIGPDGSKRALTGTVKEGASFLFGAIAEGGALYICEGFATGATIHKAKGCPVLVTFGSGNLPPVALAAKAAFPDVDFTIASDDDWTKDGNPGRTKGREAAQAIDARAIPDFSGCDDRGAEDTDFNDLARLRGLDAVRECLDRAEYVKAHEADAEDVEEAFEAEPDPVVEDAATEDVFEADEFADETDDAEAAARASALRAILIDGLDTKDTEQRLKRQWPQLRDKIPTIIDSAARTAEKWKPGSECKIGGILKRITSLDQINERFVMVEALGQASCVVHRRDALFMARPDFVARLAGSVIVTSVSNKCVVKTQAAALVWMGDCRRRIANDIVFTSREGRPDCLNLWTGFGATPQAGRCDLIYQHIKEVICAGNLVAYEAMLNLLAWQVQNIGRSSRIIITLSLFNPVSILISKSHCPAWKLVPYLLRSCFSNLLS